MNKFASTIQPKTKLNLGDMLRMLVNDAAWTNHKQRSYTKTAS